MKVIQVAASRTMRQIGPPLLEQAYVLADLMAAQEEKRQPRTSIFDNLSSLAMVMAAREAVSGSGKARIMTYGRLMGK